MRGKCEGRLVSTKPLSWSGQVINNFTVDFKDGKVVDCHAEQGEEVLKKMFAMDEAPRCSARLHSFRRSPRSTSPV